jgi:sulfur carrier protein
MMIFVNGEKITQDFKTLYDVCLAFSDDSEAVATALNGDFVPKSSRKITLIQNGDTIEIIAPLEGG